MVRLTPEDAGPEGPVFSGHGADTDIIVASAKAYVNALNKMVAAQTAQAAAAKAGTASETAAAAEPAAAVPS